jgi:hypothetical protein
MTLNEQKRFAEKFMARRTSRIVAVQSGFNEQFAADPYNSGTLEETVESSNGTPTGTTRDDSTDADWNGTAPGGSNDDSPIYGAISIIQQHIASLGNDDLLNKWASTADALKKTVTSGVAQASPNADGVTESVRHVSDNDSSSKPGSHGYIGTSELSRMESEAGKLTKMSSKIVGVTAL